MNIIVLQFHALYCKLEVLQNVKHYNSEKKDKTNFNKVKKLAETEFLILKRHMKASSNNNEWSTSCGQFSRKWCVLKMVSCQLPVFYFFTKHTALFKL